MSRTLATSTTALIALSLTAGFTLSAAHAAQSSLSSTGGSSPLGKPSLGKPTISVPSGSTTVTPSGPYTTSPNWRPVSGYTGDHSVIYSLAGSTYALNRLAFYEHSDDPNHIEIWMEQLCHDQPCDPGPRDGSLHVGNKDENEGSKEIIAAGDDHYITAIQVCTTDENDVRNRKIKGALSTALATIRWSSIGRTATTIGAKSSSASATASRSASRPTIMTTRRSGTTGITLPGSSWNAPTSKTPARTPRACRSELVDAGH
jgi:hypothetical protein